MVTIYVSGEALRTVAWAVVACVTAIVVGRRGW